jgi:uncharacterized protein (TIGR00255 family)
MIRSMTAFARRAADTEWGQLTWELRSVNHRYLEIATRLPEDLRAIEQVLRERAGKRLKRGKLDCNLRLRGTAAVPGDIELDTGYLDRVLEAARVVAGRIDAPAPLDPLELLRWPGVVQVTQPDVTPLAETALGLFDEALDELIETREREGARIRDLLLERLAAMEPLVEAVRKRLPEVKARIRERLLARLAEVGVEADPGRLEQELVFQAQKLDVDEELDRLSGHIAEVRRVLARSEAVGRRLDFLMQELNREANTLASKSADGETTKAAVDLKVLIEQMREQVQNVE